MIRWAYLMVKEINVLPETAPRIPSIAAEADRYFRLNSTVLEANSEELTRLGAAVTNTKVV